MAGVAKSGRKRNTDAIQKTRRSLAQLNGRALEAIKQALDEGDPKIAQWILEMNLGKPKQQVESAFPPGSIVTFTLALGEPDDDGN